MKLLKGIIDLIKVASFTILPFIVYSLLLKILENIISGEMFVRMMIIASIIFAIILKIKMKKGE